LLLGLSEEEIFADSVNGLKFKVYGISRTLTKIKDFRKLQSMLQVIGSSEVFMEAFAKKYDFNKLLEEIMRSLDINTDKIKLPEAELGMEAANPMAALQGAPNAQSQIPQAGAAVNDNAEEAGGLPRSGFPQVPSQ
jgi:hypothetical protein